MNIPSYRGECPPKKINLNPYSFLADCESMATNILPEECCVGDGYVVIYKESKDLIPSNPPLQQCYGL